MYLISRTLMTSLCLFIFHLALAQNNPVNPHAFEAGILLAGAETLFYGASGQYTIPLSQKKHYPTLGLSLTMYFDLKGESEAGAYLKNDVDMRTIPALHLGYAFNFNRVQLNFDLPIGTSIAITKGTLINDRMGFEQDFSNTKFLWHYGLAFSPKYRLNNNNQVGFFTFLPLVPDKAWSGYQFGIGWTKAFRR